MASKFQINSSMCRYFDYGTIFMEAMESCTMTKISWGDVTKLLSVTVFPNLIPTLKIGRFAPNDPVQFRKLFSQCFEKNFLHFTTVSNFEPIFRTLTLDSRTFQQREKPQMQSKFKNHFVSNNVSNSTSNRLTWLTTAEDLQQGFQGEAKE